MRVFFLFSIIFLFLSSSLIAERRQRKTKREAISQRTPLILPEVRKKKPLFSICPIFGYGFGSGKKETEGEFEYDKDGKIVKDKNLYYSAGQGLKLCFVLDYALFNNIMVDFDIGYSKGFDSEVYKYKWWSEMDSTWYTGNAKIKTSYIFFSPCVKISQEIMGFTPFCSFGLFFALSPKSSLKYEEHARETLSAESKLTYKMGIGSFGSIGIKYTLLGGIAFIGEIRGEQISLKASHGKVTKYIVDGKDKLNELTTREKEIEYRDDASSDNPSDTTKPCIERTFIIPANNVSIRLGLSYSF